MYCWGLSLVRFHLLLFRYIANEIDPDAKLQGYSDLYAWSVGRLEAHRASRGHDHGEREAIKRSDTLQKFWSAVWDDTGVVGEKGVSDGVPLEVSVAVPSSILDLVLFCL